MVSKFPKTGERDSEKQTANGARNSNESAQFPFRRPWNQRRLDNHTIANLTCPHVTAGSLGLVVSVPLAIGLGLIGQFLYPSGLHASFALVGVSLAPTALIMVIEMILIGQERLSFVAFINIMESALRFIVFITIIYFGATLTEIILAFVALRFVTLFLYLLDRRTFILLQPSAFRPILLLQLLKQAPILFSILILSTVFSRIDVTFLSKMASDADVAIYSIAARLYDLALIVPGVLIMVLLPILSRLHAKNPDGVSQLCKLAFSDQIALYPAAAK